MSDAEGGRNTCYERETKTRMPPSEGELSEVLQIGKGQDDGTATLLRYSGAGHV